MIKFTKKEADFIRKRSEARVATVSSKGWPQVTTVVHAFNGRHIYFAMDYGSRKRKNLLHSNKISIIIDVYERQPKAVMMQGRAELLEKGKDFAYTRHLLEMRHAYFQANKIKETKAVLVKITPIRKVSWGIDDSHR
ncbi:MAG: pyridoxamine 5'-phosphate oxidase family protein [Candidatus Micrarchaeota archaeon]|nr:pyridoxamine 5'-phosphate oxidase family protein [Candidatus Micrarchaeota archaeon]MDE1864165.1 pyridoxamine 5'-phosphate oxidase family protein [Candidatus Micrarchaeota archaeon]